MRKPPPPRPYGATPRATSDRELRTAEYTAKTLRKVGFALYELVEGGYTATELKEAGYNAVELKEMGFTAKLLREAGFKSKQLHAARYKLRELQEGGFLWQDLGARWLYVAWHVQGHPPLRELALTLCAASSKCASHAGLSASCVHGSHLSEGDAC